MPAFQLTGIESATISADRTAFEFRFRTSQGSLDLSLQVEHLDHLITVLNDLEHLSSLHDPVAGIAPGERGSLRAAIVDEHRVMNGHVNGAPCVFLGLHSGKVLKWFALDAGRAASLQQAVRDEIPKLQVGPSSH
jgi:hypothetical protein